MKSIYKRGSTYTYVLDLGKDPVTGKRRQKSKGGFTRKKDAELALKEAQVKVSQRTYVIPSKVKFSEFITKWFNEHYSARIEQNTVKDRKYLVDKHLIRENTFARMEMSKITAAEIDSFYNSKLNKYSTAHIRKMHQLLNLAFEQAVKWEYISTNPVTKSDPPKVKKKEFQIWSYEDIHKFLQHSINSQHHLAFLIAIYTGMRRGEILGLKWADIDFTKKTIHVKRSFNYLGKKGITFSSGKTNNSNRSIPISKELLEALIVHKAKQEKDKDKYKNIYNDGDFVVTTRFGNNIIPRNLERTYKRLLKESGVHPIRFHDIRHTHASILISEKVDLVKVSKRLGHATPKVTLEYYSHLIPNEDNEVADVFAKAISTNVSKMLASP